MRETHRSQALQDGTEAEYGDKASRVFRVLLAPEKDKRPGTWYKIAKEAETAYGWTHSILSRLQDKGYIKGTNILDPEALFRTWLARPRHRKYREYHIKKPVNILSLDHEPEYAITTYFAEEVVGAYLFPRYLDLYVEKKQTIYWHDQLTNRGYAGKGNVRLLLDEPHVFYGTRTVKGRRIVSIQQLILDLLAEGAECAEAAQLLIGRYYDE